MPNQFTRKRFKNGLQWCNKHQDYLNPELFYKYPDGTSSYYCQECAKFSARKLHKAKENDREYQRSKRSGWIKRAHGITLQEYEEKLAKQNNACAICDVQLVARGHLTHLDHDHKTGVLRQFLCTNCNRGLGHFQDSIELLEKASKYLRAHSVNVTDTKEDKFNDCSH